LIVFPVCGVLHSAQYCLFLNMLIDRIKALSKTYSKDFIAVRRHLHAYPELSYQEFETSRFVRQKLDEFGISNEVKATTGVVGIISGRNPASRVVALRADMDALPIKEENDVSYRSTQAGVMHACGHDVHTSCLLGASKILNELRDDWEGTVKLIFQPGEEKNPGGASLMIRDGVLQNPAPQAIFGLHVNPQLETGKLSFRSGQVMASADELYLTIRGKGGHAAAPQNCIDPILISAHLILALQQVISRHRNPFDPSVLSITSINGGTTTNVIPDEVKLMGTFRAMNEEWRSRAHQLIEKIARELVISMGGQVDIHIDKGYPTVVNDERLHERARNLAEAFIGKENVDETEVRMGAEDFGYYSQQVPGCFYRLGTGNKKRGITAGVHTPHFDVDENAIEIGMGMMAWLGSSAKL
jgi:amidohydrolase